MNKVAGLQSALNASTGRVTTEAAVQPTAAHVGKMQTLSGKAGTRQGKKNIAAWLPNDFKKSIRLVQAKLPGDPSLEDLMAEAFNDLFTKYNVPTVWQTKA
jgi:hypothetical protein